MQLIIRYLLSLIRSRRRFPFLLATSLLLCTLFILFTINHNHQSNDLLPNENEQIMSIKNRTISRSAVIIQTTITTSITTTNPK